MLADAYLIGMCKNVVGVFLDTGIRLVCSVECDTIWVR